MSMKDKMKPASAAGTRATKSVSDSFKTAAAEEELSPLNARIPKDLKTEVKIYCAENDVKMQDFVTSAVSEYLKNKK